MPAGPFHLLREHLNFQQNVPIVLEEVLVFGEAFYFFPLNLFDLLQNSSMSC